MLLLLCLCPAFQECFSAGYASFNLEPVQYSTTAAAAYPEANKYDPKGVDKYGHEAMPAKVSTNGSCMPEGGTRSGVHHVGPGITRGSPELGQLAGVWAGLI